MRKRRIIIDNDASTDLNYEGADIKEHIVSTINTYAGTQVDTICWLLGDTNSYFMYNTKAGELPTGNGGRVVQTLAGEPTGNGGRLAQNLRALLAEGTDPLEIAIKEGHKRNLEIFANLRLNDAHWWSMPETTSRFCKENYSKYRVKGVKGWGGVEGCLDYSFPQVREKQLEIIYDVATRYEIDGFHLDFMRCPPFFSPMCARKKAPILTQFIGEVKETLTKIGKDKGKNIPLSARIRKSLLLCEEAGMDIKTWVKKDLFEFIAPGESNANDFNIPVAEFKKITKDTDCGLYPCICASNYDALRFTPEQYRAYAFNCYREGADGVFLFNRGYYGDLHLLLELGGPRTIGKKRHYIFFHYAGSPTREDRDSIQTHIYNERDNNLPSWSRRNKKIKKTPATISLGDIPHLKVGRQNILLSDNWAKVTFNLADAKGRLCFKLAGMTPKDEMKLKINNTSIGKERIKKERFPSGRTKHPVPIPPYYQYGVKVTAQDVKKGINELKVLVSPRTQMVKNDIKMWELELMVKEK